MAKGGDDRGRGFAVERPGPLRRLRLLAARRGHTAGVLDAAGQTSPKVHFSGTRQRIKGEPYFGDRTSCRNAKHPSHDAIGERSAAP